MGGDDGEDDQDAQRDHTSERAVAIADDGAQHEMPEAEPEVLGACECIARGAAFLARAVQTIPFAGGKDLSRLFLMPGVAQEFGILGIGLGTKLAVEIAALFQPLHPRGRGGDLAADAVIGEAVEKKMVGIGPVFRVVIQFGDMRAIQADCALG